MTNLEKSSKIKLFIDFDGTLVNSIKQSVAMLNNHYNRNIDYTKVMKYNFKDKFPTNNEIIKNIFNSEEFFNNVECFEDAINILNELSNDYEIIFTTIGTDENLRRKKEWFKKYITFDYKINFIQGNIMDKSCIDMSNGILIDDHIDNIRSSNAKFKILYADQLRKVEWNDYLENIEYYITENWKQIKQILNFYKEHQGEF